MWSFIKLWRTVNPLLDWPAYRKEESPTRWETTWNQLHLLLSLHYKSVNLSVWSFTVPLRCPSLFQRTDVAFLPWNGWSQSAGRTNTDGHICMRNSHRSCWQRPPRRVTLSRRSLSCTRWPKPTGPMLTIAGGSWTAHGTEMLSFQCFLTFADCMYAVLASLARKRICVMSSSKH